jgi:hypothetical protein
MTMKQGVPLCALTCVLCWSFSAPAQSAAPTTQTETAERHFTRGYALVEAHDYEAAALEFEQAYAKSPHHSVLYNLGQAYALAGQHVAAVKALRKFLTEAKEADPALLARARVTLAASERHVGSLLLTVPPEALVSLDGQELKQPAQEQLLTSGAHGVWVQAPGYRDGYRSFVIEPGEVSELSVELQPVAIAPPAAAVPAPQKPAPVANEQPKSRLTSYVLAGTSLVLGGGALVIYLKNSADHRAWQARRDRFAEQPTAAGMINQAQRDELARLLEEAARQQRWDDVALGLGIGAGVSLGAAVVLFWQGAPSSREHGQLHFDGRNVAWSTTW